MYNRKNKLFTLVFAVLFTGCTNEKISELKVTTPLHQEASRFFNKAMNYFQIGENVEKRLYLDSALSIDPNFALALEFYDNPEFFKRKEDQKSNESYRKYKR